MMNDQLLEMFVNQQPAASVYHTPDWQRVIQNTYGYTPRYILSNEAQQIKGMLPLFEINSVISGRHLVATPFSHQVTALYENEDSLQEVVSQAKKIAYKRGCKYIEIRGNASALAKLGFQASTHNWISKLDLQIGEKALWNNLQSSVQRNIRKARQSGLTVRRGVTKNDFVAFYSIMLETRRLQGTPPYPSRLFTELQSMPQARLYLTYHESQVLAGIILFCYRSEVIYAYGASIKNPHLLRMRPNDLLFWQVISEMQAEGYGTFDFGSTPTGNKDLLRFKEHWGAESKPLAYAYWLNTAKCLPVVERESHIVKMANLAIHRMPLWALRFLGELIFKHLG